VSRFQFRLARVLRVRKVQEDVARSHFQACEDVARQAETVAGNISVEIERAQAELFDTRARKRIPPEDLLMAQETLESLDRTLQEQKRRARELREEAETMRAAWEEARRDALSLESLAERDLAAHADEEERSANAELDEFAHRRLSGGEPLTDQYRPTAGAGADTSAGADWWESGFFGPVADDADSHGTDPS
jgi:flagellar export protein FliJ